MALVATGLSGVGGAALRRRSRASGGSATA
ncbi:MAG: hypothetical protein ACREPM_04065 [Gemmatimonadaceae bacterium]